MTPTHPPVISVRRRARRCTVVRDQIKEFASTRIMFSSAPKMIILDEADNMTSAAQAALRRVIEKHTKNAVRPLPPSPPSAAMTSGSAGLCCRRSWHRTSERCAWRSNRPTAPRWHH